MLKSPPAAPTPTRTPSAGGESAGGQRAHRMTLVQTTPRRIAARPQGARLMLAVACALALCQCKRKDDATTGFPRNETLYVGGPPWGEPSSVNPLASSPDWPVKYFFELMYETLFIYNSVTGELEPHLAQSFTQHEDRVEVHLRPEARWSDGQPVTAEDVRYTIELGREHKGAPVAPLWSYITKVTILDADAPQPLHSALYLNADRKRAEARRVGDAVR